MLVCMHACMHVYSRFSCNEGYTDIAWNSVQRNRWSCSTPVNECLSKTIRERLISFNKYRWIATKVKAISQYLTEQH